MGRSPSAARLLVIAVAVSGVATLAGSAALDAHRGVGSIPVFVSLVVLLSLSWAYPILMPKDCGVEALQVDEACMVALALLCTPFGTIVAFAIGIIVGQIVRRRPLVKGAFNFGQIVVSVGLGLFTMHVLESHIGEGRVTGAIAVAVIGAAVFSAVNQAAVALIIALTEGHSFGGVYAEGIGARSIVWAGAVSLGVLAGLSGRADRWTLVFAVLPMMMLQVVVARHLKATRDNDRLDGLFRAAVEVHAPTRLQDVEEALVASSGRLLRTDGVHIGTAPPAAGELGVHLRGDGRDARWLIVPGRNDVERLRVEDQRLLDAVSAIGTAAIEKTALLEQVRRQAFHDALTGLPNQLLLDDRITQALAHAGRTGEHVAVLFLDLDNFKKVNDSLGHAVGNELLCQVARRLQAALREGDSVARMGGDEFTLLLRDVDGPEDALRVGEKLLKALAGHPFTVHRDELFITASIGVAVAPRDGSTPQTLLKNADAAMYRAKDRGKASCHMYASDMNATSYARLALEADLHNAMRREELRVFYQPLIELRTGAIAGVEALVRWQHPDLGLLGPDQFVGIAEQAGLICAVDGWVLQTACRQAQAWVEAGLPPIRVSVNISARHLHDANVVDLVRGALAASGLAPDFLELEVTESVAVQDDGGPLRVLAALRALGVHIAIDDFGMGYSMLGRLRDFPIEKVKIDKSFVQEITDGHSNAPLVAAMVAMGHSLDLTVVAEGVETVAQLSYLADLDCDLGQGYLFSQPITADAVEVLLLDGCSTTIDLTVELDQAS